MAPFQFCALPVELIEGVLKELCLACGPRHDAECPSFGCFCQCDESYGDPRIEALASLCLTSRQLNGIATRHLYHHPCGNKWWLLAATLLARPDLARLAVELSVTNPSRVEYRDCAPDLVAYFEDQFQAYTDAMAEAGDVVSLRHLKDGDSFSGSYNIPLDILVTLCPKLKRLNARLDYFEVFRFCRPQSLLHLESAALSHTDTMRGFGFDDLAGLFLSAPNITNLSFWAVDGCEPMEPGCLAKVTSLSFRWSAVGSDALINILSACPNLAALDYEMGPASVGDYQFSLREVQDAVLAHAPKLTYLRLFTEDDSHDYWDNYDAGGLGHALAARGIHLDYQHELYDDWTKPEPNALEG